ncbi:MAG TPA: RraA family protein [Hyphomicrobiaceae bacterium]|nr:RraA family protein [Hyphomicrobiaceae bacterium]
MSDRVPSSVVYDVMKAHGMEHCVLPASIRGLGAHHYALGPAFTIAGHEDNSLSAHDSLLRWSELLSRVPPETVAVCQPNTHAIALMGELSARALAVKGVRGYLVDGACRDGDLVEESGLPVFCTNLTPCDIVARWTWTTLGEPVVIGGVTISESDLIVADRDGIVVVPRIMADDILAEAGAILETESEMRHAILSGMDPKEAYLKYGKF